LTKTYDYVTKFWQHHRVPYVPSNAGHFILVDMRRFLGPENETVQAGRDLAVQAGRDLEAQLTSKLIHHGVFVAPGAQYHHPIPGFFRFTFSLESIALNVGLSRIEKTLDLEPWIEKQGLLEHD
jgi:bifunctional pyridoxal-dependent enzyme with beta-cystathionase and maltose regulon repressor activities